MRGEAIELKIIVEGIILPSRAWGAFECTAQKRGPSTGMLTVAAIPGLRDEDWARARVYVFWSDIEIRAHSTDWPILFEGEVVGSGFNKSPGGRSVVFRLMGPEVYWDQCKLYFYSFDRNPYEQGGSNLDIVNVNKKAFFFGNQKIEIEAGAPGLTLSNRILETMRNAGTDKPLPGMVRRVLKDTVGQTNHFFARANRELGLDKRFAVPRDDNVSLLYANSDLFFRQIEGNVGAQEADVSIGQVLRESLALLRYGWTSNPQPKFTTGGQKYRLRVDQERVTLTAQVEERVFSQLGVTLAELGLTAQTTDDEIEDIARERTVDLVTAMNLASATVEESDFALFEDPATTDADINERNRQRIGETGAFLRAIRDELRRLSQPATEVDQNPILPADDDQAGDELAQFLLLPETDFALPPVCNVIFPSESASYGMSRDHLNEPTRSLMSVPIVDDKIQKLYFAPESLSEAKLPAQTVTHVSVTGTFPPVLSGRITSRFGFRNNPFGEGGKKLHQGLDIGVPEGTPVFAFDRGRVVHAGPEDPNDIHKGGGIYVSVQHENGVKTQYFHLRAVLVNAGDTVNAGQQIAESGNTGRSTGPHLHFNYIVNGTRMDPEPAFNQARDNYANQGENVVEQQLDLPEVGIVEAMEDPGSRFDDFRYLTPEEEVKGIVPIFDTSMDKVAVSFERDGTETLDAYLSQIALSNFARQKIGSRAGQQIPMPFSPQVACGFPALVVDPVRSIIGQVESVTHRVSPQGPDASTMVTISQPRFWNEGDPFYWRHGQAKFKTGERVPNVPDATVARFPSFYLPSLVGTNSYRADPAIGDETEPFGGSIRNRPIDELYQTLLGVDAIPYFFAESESPATGATVAFNNAIDGLSPGVIGRSSQTIVGYYENLRDQDPHLAQEFAKSFTRRLGATEAEVMVDFLGAQPGRGGYDGGPFRERTRAVIAAYVQELTSAHVFRG